MGRHYIDITGQTFGDVTVIGVDNTSVSRAGKHKRWRCRCDLCGKEFTAESTHLRNMEITKCRSCSNRISSTKHGHSSERLYHIWLGMRKRCYNQNSKDYPQWGGRGIKICDEWGADSSLDNATGYEAFKEWSLQNGYSDAKSIDRIDNDGNYSPDNCRWATKQQQNSNTRQNVFITIDDETHTATEWSRMTGVKAATIRQRVNRGKTGRDIIAVI